VMLGRWSGGRLRLTSSGSGNESVEGGERTVREPPSEGGNDSRDVEVELDDRREVL
jgi:hypothetical protein